MLSISVLIYISIYDFFIFLYDAKHFFNFKNYKVFEPYIFYISIYDFFDDLDDLDPFNLTELIFLSTSINLPILLHS